MNLSLALLGVIYWILTLSTDVRSVGNSTKDNSYYIMFTFDLGLHCNITNVENPLNNVKGVILFWPEWYSQLNSTNDTEWIAYVNCDIPTYTTSYVSSAQKNKSSAIILYSNYSNPCGPIFSNISVPLFSLPSEDDKMCRNSSILGNKYAAITLINIDDDYGNNTETSNPPESDDKLIATTYKTAMIILYSVSGIVLGLFFIIVVANLIRNRFHPSLRTTNGNHSNPGNGIAKSVLDSFPVYLFSLSNGGKVSEDAKAGDVTSEPVLESLKVINEKRLESTVETETPSSRIEEKDIDVRVDRSADDVMEITKDPHIEDSPQTLPPSANSSAFNGIINEQLTCPICLGDFESGEELRILPCHHQYHTVCIDPWLLDTSPLCPMCKTDYTSWDKELQPHQDGFSSNSNRIVDNESRTNGNDSSHHTFPHFRWIRYLTNVRRTGGRRRRDRRARVTHSEGGGEEMHRHQRLQDDGNAINNETVEQGIGHGIFRASI